MRSSLSGDGVAKLGPLSHGVLVNCRRAEDRFGAGVESRSWDSESETDVSGSFFFFDPNRLSKPDLTRDKALADRFVKTSVADFFDSYESRLIRSTRVYALTVEASNFPLILPMMRENVTAMVLIMLSYYGSLIFTSADGRKPIKTKSVPIIRL